MTQDNNARTVAVDEASSLLEMDEDVAHADAGKVGETVVPIAEAKAINWVNLPTAEALRQHIFNIPDIKEEIVEVEEWQAKILVRGMNGEERGSVLSSSMNPNNTPNLTLMYARMCIACCYHPDTREKIWNVADVALLNTKAGGVLERLAMKGAELSGLNQEQADLLRKN